MKNDFRVTVYGAAGTVTGSKYLLTAGAHDYLIDCGVFQGKKDLRLRNWAKPKFKPDRIKSIILTHAHIDHTGYLPVLYKLGFKGPIYCTEATSDLLELLLIDAAHLQEEEANFANKWKTSKHEPAKPLYTEADARHVLKQIKTIPFYEFSEVGPGLKVKPTFAGHILGSACLTFDYKGSGVSFSGDVGRYNQPILNDPQPLEIGNCLFCESTYGDRDHGQVDSLSELEVVINRAYQRRGPILIPAFAVGRTQLLLYYIAQLEKENRIPTLPVFVDSPMAIDTTALYKKHREEFDTEALALVKDGGVILTTGKTYFCKTRDQSKQLNGLQGPRIIISASGMVNGGRILHHMRNWLPHKQTTVVFVGYQAVETRGQLIQSGVESVKIFAEEVPIHAQVETVSSLSAHADRRELIKWLKDASTAPTTCKIIHGEPEAADAFSALVTEELNWNCSVAQDEEVVEIA